MTTLPDLGQNPLDVDKPDQDDLTLWSVTTIIGALDKPALLYWSAEMAAIAAVDNQSTWQAMLEDRGRDETIKWIRDARNRRPKNRLSAAELGTVTHKVCEQYALSGSQPTADDITDLIRSIGSAQTDITAEALTVVAMLEQFDRWLQRFTPSYQATEVTVYSPEYGYAGTLDAMLTIDGVRFITDYKTSREPYDSRGKPRAPYPEQVGLQLGAYRHADMAAVWRPRRYEKQFRRYYALSAAEQALAVPVPEVDTGLVIHITPEACDAYPIICDEEVHAAFLYCLECFRWLNETSKTVMGQPLQ
jgi:ATP-dependent exoDNAse (exonuclease V) beta subunit